MDSVPTKYELSESMINSIQSIQNIFRFLLRKWWVFFIAGLIGGVGGILYAYFQKPKYESKLTFALDDGGNGGGLSGAAALAAQFGFSTGGGNDVFAGDNIISIIKSRRIVENILLSVDSSGKVPITLIEKYFSFSKIREVLDQNERMKSVRFLPGQTKNNFTRLQDSVLYSVYADFAKNFISCNRTDKKLNMIELNVVSEDEDFSKIFTERLVMEANTFYTAIRTKKSLQTLQVLEDRISRLQGGLNSSISSKATIQDANINPAYAQAQVPIQKQQVNIQVYSGAYAEMFKNLEIARFQYLNEMPLMQIIDKADYPMRKMKKGKLMTGILGSILSAFFAFLFLMILYYLNIYNNQLRRSKTGSSDLSNL